MIYYLVSQRNAGTMQEFLGTWGKALAARITAVTFEDIFSRVVTRLPPQGTYIFTSLGASLGSFDPPSQARQLVCQLHRALVGIVGTARILNDPASTMRRFELLQVLWERGINRYAAYRTVDRAIPSRYPVFLRHAEGTQWDPPPLLANAEEYRSAIAAAGNLDGLLAIEFCDTADASGIYRKYSCFVVGDRIVPRHLFFSRRWWVKEADLYDPALRDEEMAFLESNPHAGILGEISRLAGFGYGRIDYSVLDGQLQIWEINDTPLISGGISSAISARAPVHRKFVEMFTVALDAFDPPAA
jgi:hypothetical protein